MSKEYPIIILMLDYIYIYIYITQFCCLWGKKNNFREPNLTKTKQYMAFLSTFQNHAF